MLKGIMNNFAAHFGIKCSSFCKVNVGTSMRSACTSLGFSDYSSVFLSNKLLGRIPFSVCSLHSPWGAWSLEQPSGSLLEFYPTWRFILASIFRCGGDRAVTLVKWWMRHYDSATAKRHMGFANTPVISRLDKGKLSMSGFQKNPKLRTCEKYQDGSGKTRYKVTRFLKQTEIYPPRFARAVCDLVEGMKMTARGQPQITMESTPPAIETIQLDWEFDPSLWQYVDFGEVFAYLRGSTNLNIP
ncbi:unnamed protein product, partial [Cladocopium goreaui]